MKHCICALKNNKTLHDEAELTLYTAEKYRKLTGIKTGFYSNHNFKPEGDAINIHKFLVDHLPAETLKELIKILNH